MDVLKKIWFLSFKTKNEVKDLIIPVIIYVVAPTVLSIIAGIFYRIPGLSILGYLLSAVSGLFGLYCTAGAAFTFLNYFKVGPFKD